MAKNQRPRKTDPPPRKQPNIPCQSQRSTTPDEKQTNKSTKQTTVSDEIDEETVHAFPRKRSKGHS